MTDTITELKSLLGEEGFKKVANVVDNPDEPNLSHVTNVNEIYCLCKTLILKPNQAKLILPTKTMLEVEVELKHFQQSDKFPKSLVRGCYWLVDDMYKFEQMGYTKEVNTQNLQSTGSSSDGNIERQQSEAIQNSARSGLRYLACAECNLCPMGWYDPETKESYLHVWVEEK